MLKEDLRHGAGLPDIGICDPLSPPAVPALELAPLPRLQKMAAHLAQGRIPRLYSMYILQPFIGNRHVALISSAKFGWITSRSAAYA